MYLSTKFGDGCANRLLLLAYAFPPSNNAGVFRALRFVKYLPEFGWQPIVIAADATDARLPSDHSLSQQLPETATVRYTGMWWPREALDAWGRALSGLVPNWYCNSRKSGLVARSDSIDQPPSHLEVPKPSFRHRLRTYARNALYFACQTPDRRFWWIGPALAASSTAIRRYRPNVILSTGPPHSAHLIALVLARLTGIPLVLDFRDPWARDPWARPGLNPWGRQLLPQLEAISVKCAQRVILNTEFMRQEFVEYHSGEDSAKFVAIYNGYDPSELSAVPLSGSQRSCPRNSDGIRLLHAGSLHEERDPGPLLEALKTLVDEGVALRFAQCGGNYERCASYVQRFGLQDFVHAQGQISHGKLIREVAAADVFVIIQPGTATQVPSKLYEQLMFRKPVLALTGEGETARLVRRYHLGTVADPQDPVDIANKLRQIIASRGSLPVPDGVDAALRAFDGRILTGKLASVLDDVVVRTPRA